jgi:hypothetical protein
MSFVSSSLPLSVVPAWGVVVYDGFLASSAVAHLGEVSGVFLWLASFPPIAMIFDRVVPPGVAVFSLRASCLFVLVSVLALACELARHPSVCWKCCSSVLCFDEGFSLPSVFTLEGHHPDPLFLESS